MENEEEKVELTSTQELEADIEKTKAALEAWKQRRHKAEEALNLATTNITLNMGYLEGLERGLELVKKKPVG